MKKQALIIAGLLAVVAQGANAAGMVPSARLLPPGSTPAIMANDDNARNGMGEADLAPAPNAVPTPSQIQAMQPMLPVAPPTPDYIDVPALPPTALMPQTYRDGNFTFKTQ